MTTTPTTTATAEMGDEYYDDDIVDMTLGVQIPSGIGLVLLIIIAIGGNTLTILAYIIDRKLHTVYNFYILNLATTDLLLACFSMPFYAVYTLKEFTWPFGVVFCKVWLVMDFTLCFESILLMLVLSFDRLLLILLGSRYSLRITMKVAMAQIAVSWLISFLIYSPAIIGWDHWHGYSTVEHMDCDVEFAYNFAYTTVTAFVEFILPFVLLISLNTVIYYKIRQRNRILPTQLHHPRVSSNTNTVAAKTSTKEVMNSETGNGSRNNDKDTSAMGTMKVVRTGLNYPTENQTAFSRRENKAARLLAILVVAFLIFWAPYTITTVVISFCDECVNTSLYEFFNWVLWMKSAVNPLLYAYHSVQYRTNFRKLLTCGRRKQTEVSESSVNRTINTYM